MAPEPLLAVRGVVKRFGGLHALDGVSLDVGGRTITGLIGPNGAGKTTLFDVVSGLLAADAGEIRLGAERLDKIRDVNARGIGIVLVEQNARESLRLCRRGYVLVMGQTRAEGPGHELLADPEIRSAYLGG